MALNSRIVTMVSDAQGRAQSHDAGNSVLNDLADLGFAKATKDDLHRIVARAVSRERLNG